MTSQAPLRHMTAQELLEYSHEPYRQELVDGILCEMEPPGAEHGIVAMRIGVSLATYVGERDLGFAFAGEIGFQLRLDPDIRVLTADERLDLGDVVSGWSARVGDLFV